MSFIKKNVVMKREGNFSLEELKSFYIGINRGFYSFREISMPAIDMICNSSGINDVYA